MTIEVSVPCEAWLAACPEAEALADRAARAALAGAAGAPVVVDVVLTNDAEQRRLNHTYRSTDASTNVLAFALADPPADPHSDPPLPGLDPGITGEGRRDTDLPPPPLAGEGRVGVGPPRRPMPGAPVLLGDVVLAFETVAREAAEQDKPLADHLAHLVVHGVLHLLGFDHGSDGEAAAMEAREIAILEGLGVPDPYRDTM